MGGDQNRRRQISREGYRALAIVVLCISAMALSSCSRDVPKPLKQEQQFRDSLEQSVRNIVGPRFTVESTAKAWVFDDGVDFPFNTPVGWNRVAIVTAAATDQPGFVVYMTSEFRWNVKERDSYTPPQDYEPSAMTSWVEDFNSMELQRQRVFMDWWADANDGRTLRSLQAVPADELVDARPGDIYRLEWIDLETWGANQQYAYAVWDESSQNWREMSEEQVRQ